MPVLNTGTLRTVLRLLACALVLKTTAAVVWGYRDYWPPNFAADFLQGRQAYFWSGYHRAFYVHLVAGPLALLLGTLLMSERFRRRQPHWHRRLGRIQTAVILLAVVPSGLGMACFTQTGGVWAGTGFVALGIATGLSAALGWRAAVRKRFDEHRRWMTRCHLLLCAAVVLRLLGGAFTVVGYSGDWTYILAAWLSWLVPLAAFELSASALAAADAPGVSRSAGPAGFSHRP